MTKTNKSCSFEDLLVWQKAHDFVLNTYKATNSFPKDEIFGLISQYRRAAVSIAANIAEGYGKKSNNDKLRFYNIAEGSINECRYYIILSKDLKYLITDESDLLYDKLTVIQKLLYSYCKSLKENISSSNY